MASEMPRSSACGVQAAPGRVDERDNRAPKAGGELHDALGFAEAFGRGLAEVALLALAGVAPFLVAHDGDGAAPEAAEASDHRPVVAKGAVAVHLEPRRAHGIRVVQRVRAARVAGELDFLPRRQAREDRLGRVAVAIFHATILSSRSRCSRTARRLSSSICSSTLPKSSSNGSQRESMGVLSFQW
jgi:hypothetical protein